MSQRQSGYQRAILDLYETPPWPVAVLGTVLDLNGMKVWEPAAGNGHMARALRAEGADVFESDIHTYGRDILELDFIQRPLEREGHAIITNPPYGKHGALAKRFIECAIVQPRTVAMLLRSDYDAAKSRQHLFSRCPRYWGRITLTKRITWVNYKASGSPSVNHAWFIWSDEPKAQKRAWYGGAE